MVLPWLPVKRPSALRAGLLSPTEPIDLRAGLLSPTGLIGLSPTGRGLHSFTFQLNLSALYGTGGARKNSVAHDKGVLGGV